MNDKIKCESMIPSIGVDIMIYHSCSCCTQHQSQQLRPPHAIMPGGREARQKRERARGTRRFISPSHTALGVLASQRRDSEWALDSQKSVQIGRIVSRCSSCSCWQRVGWQAGMVAKLIQRLWKRSHHDGRLSTVM